MSLLPGVPARVNRRIALWLALVTALMFAPLSLGAPTAAGVPVQVIVAVAAPWPAAWNPYRYSDDTQVRDVNGDQTPSSADLASGSCTGTVCAGDQASVAYASNGTTAFFRMRLAGDVGDETRGGLTGGGYLTQIVAEGVVVAVVGVDGTSETADTVYVTDADGDPVKKVYGYPFTDRSAGLRVVAAADGTGDYFLDYQVPIKFLTSISGGTVTAATPVKLYFGTSTGAGPATLDRDFMTGAVSTAAYTDLAVVTLSVAALSVTSSATSRSGPNPPAAGRASSYSITVTAKNTGGGDLTGAKVTIPVPAGVTVSSASTARGTLAGSPLVWTVGTLHPFAVAEATLVATLTPPASTAGSEVTLVGEQDGEATDRALDLARSAAGEVITVGPVVAPPDDVPGAPTLLQAVSYDAATRLSFAPPTDPGSSPVTGYEISLDGGQQWRPLRANSANPVAGAVGGLTNGRTYVVKVRAVNLVGPGAASAAIAVMPATVPTAPRNVSAAAALTRVAVSWTPPASDGGSPVRYYLTTASPGGQTCSTRTNRCVFPQLRPSTTYSFSVVAVNAVTALRGTGTSPAARTASLYVSTRPSVPRSLVVTPGDRVLTLSFQPPASDGGSRVTGYQVTRDRGVTWTRLPTTGTTSLRATIAPVLNGSAYVLSVRAVNANGPSPATPGVTVRPPAWFFDPVSASDRSRQIDVPNNPAAYRGPLRTTKAAYRSRNGSAAFPSALLGGRQLQPGQAVNFGGGSLFAFDSDRLTTRGVAQVKAATRSLTYVSQITCEGYADYGGSRSHEIDLSRQRAAAICSLVRANARQVSSGTVAAYGPDRPVIVGGSTADRDANRRVVVLIRR